ncbi:MAG TPA: polysaccharide deacetylase family protein [Bacteroidota bacterium]|nr:polysaccharide deacetylase family protein [Bacteroidota bacterium]
MNPSLAPHIGFTQVKFGRPVRVLLYHRVLSEGTGGGRRVQAVSAQQLRDQLGLLERWGYTPITFNDYWLISRGELPPPRKPIILTLDDGYKDTSKVAVPILQEFGMKAVVFVLGDSTVERNSWDDGLDIPSAKLMSEREILELHEMGFEIGSHSLTHPRLNMLSKEKAWDEISRSRIKLEILLNAPVRAFAYPYGLLNVPLKRMVAAAGYHYACSAWSGPMTFAADPYEIRRIALSSSTGPAEFAFKVLGPYPAYSALRSEARSIIAPGRQPVHASQATSLLVVSAGLGWPDKSGFVDREAADQSPRMLPLIDALNADILDENFVRAAPAWRSFLNKSVGTNLAQILEAFAARNRYDVIISWAEHLGLPLAGLFRLTQGRTPHVSICSWISKPKKARILKMVQQSIDRIILMSSAQRDIAVNTLRIPAQRISLLRWPVDQKFWRPLGGAQDIICSVGREMRDYGTLIEALQHTGIPCHIAAAGQLDIGKQDTWMNDIARQRPLPRNLTIGKMNFCELRKLYDRSFFVVIPLFQTDTDNGTTSILEAMAMQKAVICSRVDGQRDVIQPGKTGLFVPPHDVRALREAIEYLWSHPEIAAEMGKRGREHIEKYHTLESWITEMQQIVGDVLVRSASHSRTGRVEKQGSPAPAEPQKGKEWVHQVS